MTVTEWSSIPIQSNLAARRPSALARAVARLCERFGWLNRVEAARVEEFLRNPNESMFEPLALEVPGNASYSELARYVEFERHRLEWLQSELKRERKLREQVSWWTITFAGCVALFGAAIGGLLVDHRASLRAARDDASAAAKFHASAAAADSVSLWLPTLWASAPRLTEPLAPTDGMYQRFGRALQANRILETDRVFQDECRQLLEKEAKRRPEQAAGSKSQTLERFRILDRTENSMISR